MLELARKRQGNNMECRVLMKIRMLNLNDLVEYENNPRINDCVVEAVAVSIKEFGFKFPFVVIFLFYCKNEK